MPFDLEFFISLFYNINTIFTLYILNTFHCGIVIGRQLWYLVLFYYNFCHDKYEVFNTIQSWESPCPPSIINLWLPTTARKQRFHKRCILFTIFMRD